MRRQLMICGAWVAATGAAVTLSWFGVDTVLKGTVYDPPRALPVAGTPAGPGLPEADASSTGRPSPAEPSGEPAETPGSPDGPAGPGEPDRDASAPTAADEQDDPTDPTDPTDPADGADGAESAAPAGESGDGGPSSVETVRTDGGRAAFELGEESAELVSATPAPGWDMQVWTEDGWIRVTFTAGERELSVFCVWHDSAPRIEHHES